MDSKYIYIHLWIGKDIQFYKNSGHLEFQRKHAAILDFVCFWTFLNKYFPPSCVSLHNIINYVVNSDAAYSAKETINKTKLLSLPIKSLL